MNKLNAKNIIVRILMVIIVFVIPYDAILNSSINFNFLAILTFIFIHSLKVIRIQLLANDSELSVMETASAQYTANMYSILLPFGIGELVKIFLLSRNWNLWKSFVVIFLERFFDISIFAIWGWLLVVSKSLTMLSHVPIFTAITLFFLYIFVWGESNLQFLKLILIQKKHHEIHNKTLKILSSAERLIVEVKKFTEERISFLMIISLLIWGLELFLLMTLLEIDVSEIYRRGFSFFLQRSINDFSGILNYFASTVSVEYASVILRASLVMFVISISLELKIRSRRG